MTRFRSRILLVAALAAAAQSASTPGAVKLPSYARQELPDGIVVDLMPRPGVPLVSMCVFVKGGAESDPPGEGGLASMTAEMLRRGTATLGAAQFAEQFESLGANLDVRVDAQSTALCTEFLAKDADRAIHLLSDAALWPAFPQAEVRKALAERKEEVRAMKDELMEASRAYSQAFFFGPAHPYGHWPGGDEMSLANIDRSKIAAYHARMYTGRNLAVVAVGDFDAGAMGSGIAAAFGAAPSGTAYQWHKDDAQIPSGGRLLLVDKPGAAQTYFRIGNRGISRYSPDRIPAMLVNLEFGGRFTSLLNEALRVQSGLTYGAGSRVEEDRLTGSVALVAYTKTDSTSKAIDVALQALRQLREKGLSPDQLASTKTYFKGTFPFDGLETPRQLADQIGELEIFGLGRAEIDDLFAKVDGVTLAEANAAIQKYFGAGNLVFTLVGDAVKIRESATKYAPEMVEVPLEKPGFYTKQDAWKQP